MKRLLCTLIVVLTFIPAVYAEQTPREVVEIFDDAYGTADMDRCGPITTAKMRKDRPASVWVYDIWKGLQRRAG